MPSKPIFYHLVYRHGVDEKRRLQIPAKWRPAKPEVLTLVLWPPGTMSEACLLVLPPKQWKALVQQITTMPFADPNAQALRRLIGGNSDPVTPDSSGRICLPEGMAKAAAIEIDKEAVLVGLVDRFQIWNPERYRATSVKDEQLLPEAFKLI